MGDAAVGARVFGFMKEAARLLEAVNGSRLEWAYESIKAEAPLRLQALEFRYKFRSAELSRRRAS
jgi:hypothetical protein